MMGTGEEGHDASDLGGVAGRRGLGPPSSPFLLQAYNQLQAVPSCAINLAPGTV